MNKHIIGYGLRHKKTHMMLCVSSEPRRTCSCWRTKHTSDCEYSIYFQFTDIPAPIWIVPNAEAAKFVLADDYLHVYNKELADYPYPYFRPEPNIASINLFNYEVTEVFIDM